jgi:hypothetical protein
MSPILKNENKTLHSRPKGVNECGHETRQSSGTEPLR